MEVIAGAPPAEFGEKTSVVINATTRSGQGLTTPTGSVTTSYGSFGTSTVGINVGYGGPKWGNFVSASGLNTGRFLDPPEFTVIHAKHASEMRAELQRLKRDTETGRMPSASSGRVASLQESGTQAAITQATPPSLNLRSATYPAKCDTAQASMRALVRALVAQSGRSLSWAVIFT
jgi:hypothetical protein